MLIDLDLDRVLRRAAIIGPEVALAEAHAVKRLARQAGTVVGELLGIGEGAADALDLAHLPADVPGRADMAGRRGAAHPDARARREARRHRRVGCGVHGASATPPASIAAKRPG